MTSHALLIGISYYSPIPQPDGTSKKVSLNGCVNDVRLMERFLTQNIGSNLNITKLTATNTGSSSDPPEAKEDLPTYERIVTAFKTITEQAEEGDQVYIHYSGHGAQVDTLWPDIKAPGAKDETIVPTDIGTTNGRHLRDLEVAFLLEQMIDKELSVSVILDSCHSGGATRLVPNGLKFRSLNNIITTHNNRSQEMSAVAQKEKLRETWLRVSGSLAAAPNFRLSRGGLGTQKGYVLLAACQPEELAAEFTFGPNDVGGLLTRFLIESLNTPRLGPKASYQDLCDRISKRVSAFTENQNPIVIGEATRRFT